MAAGATYEPIYSTTLSTNAASITFSSIAASWTDLKLIFVTTITSSAHTKVQLNNDTAGNYSAIIIKNTGTSNSTSTSDSNGNYIFVSNMPSVSVPCFYTYDFFNYAGNTYKTCLSSSSTDINGSGVVGRSVSSWRSTDAITSIKIDSNGNNFKPGTIATLYGIKAA